MSKIKIFSLGGLNELGKNMYVVDVDNDVFIFDAGLKYPDDKLLGIDYILPNYDYIKENKERIKGIFITHGHNEQMGAIPDIIKDIPNIKVYGTTFTIELLKEELLDENINSNNLICITPHRKIDFGKNSIFPISLTHSVPDTVGYVLNTEDGAIFYTGNFVFDPKMIGNYKTDIGKLAYIGKQGVLCLLSESLYADKKGFTSPNHRISSIVRETLLKHDGRILYNVSQAQLYRLQELFNEVVVTDRRIVILGKKLEQIVLKAIDMHYIDFDKKRIGTLREVNEPGIVVIISDDREKPFSNITRIINGYDKFIHISDSDTVVFASPVYEGMELSATKVYDKISQIGADLVIIPSKKYLGYHASSEDLMLMLNLMSPKYYFPVIGEYRHMVANSKAALSLGMNKENIILNLNGQVATFVNGNLVETGEQVKVDDILIDGKTNGDVGELVIKDREMLSDNGIVIVSASIDRQNKKILAGPEILTRGFIYVKDNVDLLKEASKISLEVITENIKDNYVDFGKIKSGIRDKLGKYLYEQTECNPMILIVVQEI